MVSLTKIKRKSTYAVNVGGIKIGGNNPIVIQSMTNTLTEDVDKTVTQIIELFDAGSEIVRVTVNDNNAAKAVPKIKDTLLKKGFLVPLVGCFHYNGHQLLKNFPECAKSLDKYRINPGNVGFKNKRDKNFEEIIELALHHDKPIRIGVNWGSLDEDLIVNLMDANSKKSNPEESDYIMRQAMVLSAIQSADKAEKIGMQKDKIIISAKLSKVQDLVSVYRELSERIKYPLHLGLTEAGIGTKAIVATTTALSILLQEGIGDTIRASITPAINQSRSGEVKLCREILQSLEIKNFNPQIASCPGCGRTSSTYFQQLAEDIQNYIDLKTIHWAKQYKDVENLKIAIMGCIVNGPGESKHADIGISLPGNGEEDVAVVYINGKKSHTLRGKDIKLTFIQLIEDYIEKNYQKIEK
ncbi:MAG: (E)-4-hydroxy-3-methylbut-2-enyl-diphosphate synthase [Candidatus Midichloriaceae bacterium]|jgi:(E)-4-hydroxy-3-methylbut-2-enyl-diphosphate synthase